MLDLKKDKDNIVIFSQSVGDLPYVLKTYEDNKENYNIILIIINVENVYKFLLTLHLQVKAIVYIPYELKGLKEVWLYGKEKRRLRNIYLKHIQLIKNIKKVYFYSIFSDWITFCFVMWIKNDYDSDVYYVDFQDNINLKTIKSKKTFQNIFRVFLLKVLTCGIRFAYDVNDYNEFRFLYETYPIKKIKIDIKSFNLDTYLVDVYKYCNRKSKNALFYLSKYTEGYAKDGFYDTYEKIFSILHKNNYSITIKAHPREGEVDELKGKYDYSIPTYIPAEFLNLQPFDLILGIHSYAIIGVSNLYKIKTMALFYLFDFDDVSIKNRFIEFFKKNSKENIDFPKSYEELNSLLRLR